MNKLLHCAKHGVDMHVFLKSPGRTGGKSRTRVVAVCPKCDKVAKLNDRTAPGFGTGKDRNFVWVQL